MSAAIENKVKLVIWDLDETFWRGTLTEGGIEPIARNIEMVKELTARGIVNSICSKNDFADTKAKLVELGMWDYFVFPSISFNPKGKPIAEMIEGAALRAENVLFVDDNRMNLEEVKYFNPGIMTAHPDEVLDELLDHPHLIGKPDPEHTRLKQYQFLQRKVEERSESDLSNEEFLRASNIRITIDYDVDANFDRVVELINRTNQLNYTKKRLETPEALAEFRELFNTFGYQAGCVRAVDDYGDYGLIGFFVVFRRYWIRKLVHFVFSCRTMNMGIEQYIYEMLGRPEIDIVPPVSYGLESHAAIDWINSENVDEGGKATAKSRKLVLIGGCDLLQLASYCSTNRLEFLNTCQNDIMVRYDDPGFFLSDRAAVRDCEPLKQIPCWTYEDMVKFDEGVASADIVLVSMWMAMNGQYFKTDGDVFTRLKEERIKRFKPDDPGWFDQHFQEMKVDSAQRLEMIRASFDELRRRIRPDCQVFALGAYSKGELDRRHLRKRRTFNTATREYCEEFPQQFRYVDLDAIIPEETLVSKTHFSRAGYFKLARHILDIADAEAEAVLAAS